MTDAEFLDELQRRAAEHITVFITNDEWIRIGELFDGRPRLDVVPGVRDTWATEASLMFREIIRAREALAARVKQRLLGKR